MRRVRLALVMAALLGFAAAADPVQDFLLQDCCLDAGGRWIAADRRCDFGMGVPLQ